MLDIEHKKVIEQLVKDTINKTLGPRSLMHPSFDNCSVMYAFTTENLKDTLPKLHPKGKDVLSVTASGDHIINLAYLGAKRCDSFDISANASFMAELKIAALKTLSYEEFLTFFTDSASREIVYHGVMAGQKTVDNNYQVFSYQTYERIRPALSEESAYYWDLMYQYYDYQGTLFVGMSLPNDYGDEDFRTRYNQKLEGSPIIFGSDRETAITNNAYLQSETDYNLAKERIRDISKDYHVCNLLELHKLSRPYDIVMLSNIYEYLTDEYYSVISADAFGKYVTEDLTAILKPEAIVQVAYQYHYKTKNETFKPTLKNLFSKGKYSFQKRPELDKYKFKKMLVPSMVKEYRQGGDMDVSYLYENGKSK